MVVDTDFIHPDDIIDKYGCHICKAQATGYHFGAQSCSACAAFFRRTVALHKHFTCTTGQNDCFIHYSTQICRSCRFKACLAAGMKQSSVQPRKSEVEKRRAFCTVSGLRRNKKFAFRKTLLNEEEDDILLQKHTKQCLSRIVVPKQEKYHLECQVEGTSSGSNEDKLIYSTTQAVAKPLTHETHDDNKVNNKNNISRKTVEIECDVFKRLIKEEMKITERRRIMFCDRPVGMLLGLTKTSPFTSSEIRPLKFRHFRKSIRTHILLIYEWLRCWPVYEKFSNIDRITILRNCVLYHTILDPSYITVQIGYPERFVMHNGGFVSASDSSEEGWEDEAEISSETKKRIYKPLMHMMLTKIVTPMVSMKICFEEFVALKAIISLQSTVFEVSAETRPILRGILDALFRKIHLFYIENNSDVAIRFGNLILLLSNILVRNELMVDILS